MDKSDIPDLAKVFFMLLFFICLPINLFLFLFFPGFFLVSICKFAREILFSLPFDHVFSQTFLLPETCQIS